MLKDLTDLTTTARTNIDATFDQELIFTPEDYKTITNEYRKAKPLDKVRLVDSDLRFDNDNKGWKTAYLTFKWFNRIHQCQGLIAGLYDYLPYLALINDIDRNLLAKLPAEDWSTNLDPSDSKILDDFINAHFNNIQDKGFFSDFLDGRWLGKKGGRRYDRRTDEIVGSTFVFVTKLIAEDCGKLIKFIELYQESKVVRDLISSLSNTRPISTSYGPPKTGGQNIIFYGPPGTGKSTEMKTRISDSPKVITVFHPDMQNSDFIGALKPAVDGKEVTYKFSPGPFAKALSEAYNHPDKNVYLVIEELNRAPAMAVFGELFQLLDRKDHGESEYEVDFPSDEFREWLDQETMVVNTKIKLPSNLSIYASMNTADQGVYPLDNAFRRRWDDEYICIDWDSDDMQDIKIDIFNANGIEKETSWKLLGSAVNKVLLENNYPEDRLLGQFWINKKDVPKGANTVPNKLLNYLWNDLLRHDEPTRHEIFKSSIKSFSMLIRQNTKDLKEQIFSDEFLNKLVS
jgi:hypothetical protein